MPQVSKAHCLVGVKVEFGNGIEQVNIEKENSGDDTPLH